MTNPQIAEKLALAGKLKELMGENPFKVRAYENAAYAVEAYGSSLAQALNLGQQWGKDIRIQGVGSSLQTAIEHLVQSGTFPALAELEATVPPGVRELARLPGLGPKKIQQLWQEQAITEPDLLRAALADGRLVKVKGFGQKVVEGLQRGLDFYEQSRGHLRLDAATALAETLLATLRTTGARAEATGALRRCCPSLPAVELLTALAPEQIAALLADYAWQAEVNVLKAPLPGGSFVHIHTTPAEAFEAQWLLTTTWGEHKQALAPHALPGLTEADIYRQAGMDWVPPEMRENRGELDLARQNRLPVLINPQDLKGLVHNHSTYSDGTHTLREMAEATRSRGYEYFGICDHSQTAAYAGGLKPDDVSRQWAEIDQLNAELAPFTVLKGIESDILPDGALDYTDDVLAGFHLVVVSVHQGLNMDQATATERLLKAVANPHTRILGHPTGRLLLARPGYPIDHEAVLQACAHHQVAVELNAHPYRLDLDWTWVARAAELGVWVSINPDAHSTTDLDLVHWGVKVARKAGLTARQTLNALDTPALMTFLDRA